MVGQAKQRGTSLQNLILAKFFLTKSSAENIFLTFCAAELLSWLSLCLGGVGWGGAQVKPVFRCRSRAGRNWQMNRSDSDSESNFVDRDR